MDGLIEDTGVVFLLTTDRVEVLELALALAVRPGRVDEAIERPLLYALCRRKIFGSGSQSAIGKGVRSDCNRRLRKWASIWFSKRIPSQTHEC